ncbi:hypothetical protein JL722_2029 [Aureococcus anophagefferens]|nr:hypothetical protein JL722_2029 [Aureococcus anophagefferens]
MRPPSPRSRRFSAAGAFRAPTTQTRRRTERRGFFGFGDDEKEAPTLEPYETSPWFSACRRHLATCIMCAFEEETTLSERDAQLEAAAADVRLRALAKQVEKRRPARWTGRRVRRPTASRGSRAGPAAAAGARPGSASPRTGRRKTSRRRRGAAVSALAAHLLEKYEAIPPLRASVLLDATSDPQRTNRVALRFLRAYASAAASPARRSALQARAADHEEGRGGLLRQPRGAPSRRSAKPRPRRSARRTGSATPQRRRRRRANEPVVESFFDQDALRWCATHAEELAEPSTASLALDYLCEMRRSDDGYCRGPDSQDRREQMDAYALSSTVFDDDEAFLPNPRGIKPLFLEGAVIPRSNVDGAARRALQLRPRALRARPGTDRGAKPKTVRVEEILSLKRLIYEGNQLDNCLEDRRSSQVKYVMRARQRVSSFWSFTLSDAAGKLDHVLLLEVWHLRGQNIVRQAEGPRPRTLPSPEAWHWMKVWCEREGVDWQTWDIYSRLEQIYPVEPL